MAIADIHDHDRSPFLGHPQGRLGDILLEFHLGSAAAKLLDACSKDTPDQEQIQAASLYFGALVLEEVDLDMDTPGEERALALLHVLYHERATRWTNAARSVLSLYAENDETVMGFFRKTVFFSNDTEEQKRAYYGSHQWHVWLTQNDPGTKDRALLGHAGLQ